MGVNDVIDLAILATEQYAILLAPKNITGSIAYPCFEPFVVI